MRRRRQAELCLQEELLMYFDYVADLLRSIPAAASRRGIVAGLTAGLIAAGPFRKLADETEAKNSKRKKNRKKKRRGNAQQPPSPPSPPPPPAPATRAD